MNNIIVAILTSGSVSAVVAFAIRTGFEARLKHHFDLELEKLRQSYEVALEKLKAELTIMAETAHELTQRRLTEYPQLVELTYRLRNIAREIVAPTETAPIVISEFAARTKELEDRLYAYRLDLERDGVFLPLHTYKNTVKTFRRLLEDRDHYEILGDKSKTQMVSNELNSLYVEIEKQHKPLIESLSVIVPTQEKKMGRNDTGAASKALLSDKRREREGG